MSLPSLRVGLSSAALFLLIACGGVPKPAPYTPGELASAKGQLRDHVRLRTFEAGVALGQEWIERVPEDAELRALYARQLAGWGLPREIHEQSDAILSRDADDPWGLYARALGFLADMDARSAIELSLRAWEIAPRADFAATHLQALQAESVEGALGFLMTLDAVTRVSPEVLALEAEIAFQARSRRSGSTGLRSGFETLEELRERWPDHVDGYLAAATHSYRPNGAAQSLALIEKAVALAPGSVDVRSEHWRILWGPFGAVEDRRSAVEASMADFRDAAPESARGFHAMAEMYRTMKDDARARELEARIVEADHFGKYASLVHRREHQEASERMFRLGEEEGTDSPAYRAQLQVVRDAARRYLGRPLYDDRHRGEAYLNLFHALRAMDPVPPEELAQAVRGLVEHERAQPQITFEVAPLALIEHTPYALEGADLLRRGLSGKIERLHEFRWLSGPSGRSGQMERRALAKIHDEIGWAYIRAGRTEDGRRQIERAQAIAGEDAVARYELGQVYEQLAAEAVDEGDADEATSWLDEAEDAYIAGLGDGSTGDGANRAALEALYERRGGTHDGLDVYFATIDDRQRIRRRERILASRIETADTYEPFRLPRLDGSLVDSSDLGGKIAVLHFWGTWCGPCVAEMPEYQQFDERYRDDPEVEVLSISNDPTKDVIEQYLAENNFDFTVLVDDGYVRQAGVFAWPTTWFVDREGYVRFVVRGGTRKLDEEFSWRVEDLREETTGPRSTTGMPSARAPERDVVRNSAQGVGRS